jgi:hypothetical protein
LASSEFNKYAEDDDEDYDDVFGKPNGSCARFFLFYFHATRDDVTDCVGTTSAGTSSADAAAQHAAIEQVLGKVYRWIISRRGRADPSRQLGDEDTDEEDPFAEVGAFRLLYGTSCRRGL